MKRLACALMAVLLTLTATLALADGWQEVVDALKALCEGAPGAVSLPEVVEKIRAAETPEVETPGLVFSLNDRNSYDVLGYTGEAADVFIPASHEGKKVVSIGSYAFTNCRHLNSVAIPASVISIGDNVFSNCRNLTAISVDSGNPVYESDDGILYEKGKTALVRYPCSRADAAFAVPESVTRIGSSAFYYCGNLTSVTIPDSVTSIGNTAFRYCYNLTGIMIPASVISIGGGAFSGCSRMPEITVDSGNPAYESDNGVLYTKGKTALLQYPKAKPDTSFTIPDGVTVIGDFVFDDCSKLTSITIPEGVTSIGSSAFAACFALTSLTLPNSLTTIDTYAFHGCTKLSSLIIPGSVTSIGQYAFDDCYVLTIHAPAGSYAETCAAERGIPFAAM